MSKVTTVAIATPTYNEAKNIKRLIESLVAVCKTIPETQFMILVIDDNSPDGTADIAERLGKSNVVRNVDIEIMRRNKKDGLGKAYIEGFTMLLKQGFDYIIQMDADMSHNPKYLTDFINLANEGHDFVVASRYLPGGDTPDWGWHRKMLSRFGNMYTRLFLGSIITDYTGGYNMYSSALLRRVGINSIHSSGYGFLIELKYRTIQNAKSPAQIAIVFRDRQHGSSKIPKRTLFKNFVLVLQLKLRG